MVSELWLEFRLVGFGFGSGSLDSNRWLGDGFLFFIWRDTLDSDWCLVFGLVGCTGAVFFFTVGTIYMTSESVWSESVVRTETGLFSFGLVVWTPAGGLDWE